MLLQTTNATTTIKITYKLAITYETYTITNKESINTTHIMLNCKKKNAKVNILPSLIWIIRFTHSSSEQPVVVYFSFLVNKIFRIWGLTYSSVSGEWHIQQCLIVLLHSSHSKIFIAKVLTIFCCVVFSFF